jgi:hypothetical protein
MEAAIGLSYYRKNYTAMQFFYAVITLYKHKLLTRLKQLPLRRQVTFVGVLKSSQKSFNLT